jgi:hypothetical protein
MNAEFQRVGTSLPLTGDFSNYSGCKHPKAVVGVMAM